MKDPTASEMREYLNRSQFNIFEFDNFDIECAIYWFANDYHSGQDSNLYSALSTSDYSPARNEKGPTEIAKFVYDALVEEFAQ